MGGIAGRGRTRKEASVELRDIPKDRSIYILMRWVSEEVYVMR